MPPNRTYWVPWITVLIASVAGLIAAYMTIQTVQYVKTFNTSLLQVIGTSSQNVTSDQVVWTASFHTNVTSANLPSGYAELAKDQTTITSYLEGQGLPASAITFSPVTMSLNWVDCGQLPAGCNQYGPDTYQLTESMTVTSGDVTKVTNLAQDVTPLAQKGVNLSNQPLQYYFTKLASLRAQLVGTAVKDATNRANVIAGASGAKVGALVSVTTQPFQLTAANSSAVSNNGTYDTTTIDKTLSATVVVKLRLGN